jgi:membrane-associated phospholipid phosphatase
MNALIERSRPLIYAYLVILIAGLFIQFTFTQTEISLAVNQYHQIVWDKLFRYGTYLGDGFVAVMIGLVVMIWNRKAGWALLLACAVSALITQTLKHFVFNDMMRPAVVLKDYVLHFVEGVEVHEYNSFPSGHSTSAFAIGTMLCLLTEKTSSRLLILLLVLFACFSRIYLLQHFFQDTLAGSFIGFISALVVFLLMYRKEGPPQIS